MQKCNVTVLYGCVRGLQSVVTQSTVNIAEFLLCVICCYLFCCCRVASLYCFHTVGLASGKGIHSVPAVLVGFLWDLWLPPADSDKPGQRASFYRPVYRGTRAPLDFPSSFVPNLDQVESSQVLFSTFRQSLPVASPLSGSNFHPSHCHTSLDQVVILTFCISEPPPSPRLSRQSNWLQSQYFIELCIFLLFFDVSKSGWLCLC